MIRPEGESGPTGFLGSIVRIARRPAPGELVHVEFAQQNCPGFIESGHDGRIALRSMISENLRATRQTYAFHREEVLECDRNAVQRATILPADDFLFSGARRRQRFVSEDRQVGEIVIV